MLKSKKQMKEASSLGTVMTVLVSFVLLAMLFTLGTLFVSADDAPRMLCPGGMTFGVEMKCDGTLVVGFAKVRGENGLFSPAERSGISVGDVICEIDGKRIESSEDVSAAVEMSEGEPVALTVKRGNNVKKCTVTPVRSAEDGKYKTGMMLRDGTAGIGTVTFVDPISGEFGGLGHAICDTDTGIIMPLRSARVTKVTVSSVRKGRAGSPGEIKGWFGNRSIGSLSLNTEVGVFGRIEAKELSLSEAIPIAEKDEIREGDALVYCTVGGNTRGQYRVKISCINKKAKVKNFSVELVDEALLDITGGIVQGMSGSPIIQDGKLVGAVTHVLVNDPTTGYGIFIENMLNAASLPMARAS